MSENTSSIHCQKNSNETKMQTKQRKLKPTHSTEDSEKPTHSTEDSEGPIIIINDTSTTGSESESSGSPSNDELYVSQTVTLSGCDSIQSSGTELTSEGGESEVEKRPLTPSSAQTLIEFLETAFSDEGLSKDLFLLKHVKRHRHGFVSLKLLAGFKEAKKLNCDWYSLSVAAMQSKNLEVSADGCKVRRKASLPESLLDVPSSRYIAVVNLSEDLMTMESLASAFSKFGSVASLHLIKHKPGGGIPEELQSLSARVPEVAHTNCALVQYEDVWGVSKALKEFTNTTTTLHVYYNKRRPSRSATSTKNLTSTHHSYHYNPQHTNRHHQRRGSYDLEWRKRIFLQNRRDSTGSEAEEIDIRIRNLKLSERKPRQSLPNINSIRTQNKESFSLPNSPQMKRKFITKGVSRNPKGPDGTRGFHS